MFGMKLSGKTTPPGSKADVQISPVALPLPTSVLLPLLSASDLPLTATVKLFLSYQNFSREIVVHGQ